MSHEYKMGTINKWTSNVGPGGDGGEFELSDCCSEIQLAQMSNEDIEKAIHDAIFEATSEEVDIGWEIQR